MCATRRPHGQPKFYFLRSFSQMEPFSLHSECTKVKGNGNVDWGKRFNTFGPNICAFKGPGFLAPNIWPHRHPNQLPGSLNVLASVVIKGL